MGQSFTVTCLRHSGGPYHPVLTVQGGKKQNSNVNSLFRGTLLKLSGPVQSPCLEFCIKRSGKSQGREAQVMVRKQRTPGRVPKLDAVPRALLPTTSLSVDKSACSQSLGILICELWVTGSNE